MASRKLYALPVLNDDEDFENWLREVAKWQCVTDLDKKKQGPAIYLSFEEKFNHKERKKVAEFPIQALTDNKSSHDAVHSANP